MLHVHLDLLQYFLIVVSLFFAFRKVSGNMVLSGIFEHHRSCQKAILHPFPNLYSKLCQISYLDTSIPFQKLEALDVLLDPPFHMPPFGLYLPVINFWKESWDRVSMCLHHFAIKAILKFLRSQILKVWKRTYSIVAGTRTQCWASPPYLPTVDIFLSNLSIFFQRCRAMVPVLFFSLPSLTGIPRYLMGKCSSLHLKKPKVNSMDKFFLHKSTIELLSKLIFLAHATYIGIANHHLYLFCANK